MIRVYQSKEFKIIVADSIFAVAVWVCFEFEPVPEEALLAVPVLAGTFQMSVVDSIVQIISAPGILTL